MRYWLLCLFGCGMLLNTAAQQATQQRPNIIYIYADDLGYGELGAYGQQKIRTPHLDRMAAEGMRFTQHYTSMPVCAPARSMLMTGMHAGHAAIRGNYELGGFADSAERGQLPLSKASITVAEMLQQHGYATAMIGKWGLGMADTNGSPLQHGFDYYYGYLDQKQAHNYYPSHLWENDRWDSLHQPWIDVHKRLNPGTATEADFNRYKGQQYAPALLTQKALQFIDQHQQQPFFLYLPYTLPHLSLQAPDSCVQQYIGQFDEKPYYGQQGYASTKYPLSTYAAMITYLDAQVGIVQQHLQQLGLDSNTLVIFSSDNGATFHSSVDVAFFNSSAGLRGLKMDLYEGGIRMPMIARWPGRIAAGSETNHVSAQYDVFATVADLLRYKKAPKTDGLSFLPTLLGKGKQASHPFLYFEFVEKTGQIAVRMGPWKAVKSNIKKNPQASWELYHLDTDVNEQHDVAAQHPEIVAKAIAIAKREHQHPAIPVWDFADAALYPTTTQH